MVEVKNIMNMKINKTKICCLNFDKEICDHLRNQNFDVYDGSLGKIVDISDRQSHEVQILPNYDFPKNIQEYDIFITDLMNEETIIYKSEEHTKATITCENGGYFISKYPETIFNPIPFGCHCLYYSIINNSRPIINIIFQAPKKTVKYTFKDITQNNIPDQFSETNYSLTEYFADKVSYGQEIKICENNYAKTLFAGFEDEIEYNQTFRPIKNRCIDVEEKFFPLLLSKRDDIISYFYISKYEIVFMLPQLKSKKQLLDILFKDVLYRDFSEYFPFVEACSWKNNSQYYLPYHKSLLEKKEEIKHKYEIEIQKIDNKIKENNEKHNFLHDILTETGDALVQAVITYLSWLGFENILDKDKVSEKDILEEDIQVDLGKNGLLIIEVKGLYGTSKDSECSQISKVRYRRCEERGKFDVYALYVVNNERGKEPIKRTIPPFNDNQIKDAEHDKRGMLYTWQLFNLYFNIENGLITKEEARRRILNTGLIDFTPNVVKLGKPYKFYKNNTVVCVELSNVQVSKGDKLAYEEYGRYYLLTIREIQQDKNVCDQVSNGKVGIELDREVPNIDMLYLVDYKKQK